MITIIILTSLWQLWWTLTLHNLHLRPCLVWPEDNIISCRHLTPSMSHITSEWLLTRVTRGRDPVCRLMEHVTGQLRVSLQPGLTLSDAPDRGHPGAGVAGHWPGGGGAITSPQRQRGRRTLTLAAENKRMELWRNTCRDYLSMFSGPMIFSRWDKIDKANEH